MSRIEATFGELRNRNKAALVAFITAGDPELQATVPLMHGLVEAGAGIIELGIPFSDPMADGPVIQAASERALVAGVGTADVLDLVRKFRERDSTTPVVLMGYLNPIEIMGYETFASAGSDAGIDGIIIVDLPPEEGAVMNVVLRRHGIDNVHLVAPTSTLERIKLICDDASGFIYYVALRGVTGAANLDPEEVEARLSAIRSQTDLPLGVGFGIDSPGAAARIAEFADAVIVGSALVRIVADNTGDIDEMVRKASAFVAGLRAAMDQVQRRKSTAA
jgi:tryptophan synthase alpha chain